MSKNTRNRILLTAIAALLLVAVTVGGTLAWLQANTDPVTNTFTPTTIGVVLEETLPAEKTAKMIPGQDIDKDPEVTVTAPDTEAWVFIVVEESENFDDYLTYTVDAGWTPYDTANTARQEGVYYKNVPQGTTADIQILTGDKVTVLEGVTKEAMAQLTSETYPKLTFAAYTVQKDGNVDSAPEAYAILFPAAN